MKRFFLAIACLFLLSNQYAQTDTLARSLGQMNDMLQRVRDFDQQKQTGIDALKQQLATTPKNDLAAFFKGYENLYSAYKVFQYDSSYNYAKKMLAVALRLNDPSLINYARIKMGFSLLSSGMYKETLDSLSAIQISAVPDSCRAEYYALMGRYYYDLGDYDKDQYHTPRYNEKGAQYIDSALAFWRKDSYDYIYFTGLKQLRSGNRTNAKQNFDLLLARTNLTPHQVAITASTLSDLYIQTGDHNTAILLLIKAMIADMQSSTKETSAAFILSTLLYKKADIKNASVCINQAFSDAVFFGARQRKVQVGDVLPLIEAQKYAIVEQQKTKLLWYAGLVTFLLLLVVALTIIVLKQLKEGKRKQLVIMEAHRNTQEANRRLSETNEKLNDANKIKEEYIGYFFNVNSEFFDKIERFKKSVDQKLTDRKYDEIRFLVNNINLKREKEDLLKHFDRAFLKLFPNFVAEFNDLFRLEDRIELADNELLNTDLRIFALARMGIHENEKIAHILQYSVNTINTYKTRIRNKSIVPNEEFEKRIMQIKTID
ncbi:transcriptional regulator [Niastella vici]|uniref:Transcriptional regulator n=1 Tax=Niastella vici TaxID=1703345 RepID=A0A1V9FLQ4_9BACT|nr:DUF6377 domain-containing protein [Niastella vici]OQP59221.1 transcriptional regulator [Niastella vici]